MTNERVVTDTPKQLRYHGIHGTVVEREPVFGDPRVKLDRIPEGCTSDTMWFNSNQVRPLTSSEEANDHA